MLFGVVSSTVQILFESGCCHGAFQCAVQGAVQGSYDDAEVLSRVYAGVIF